MSRQKKPIKRIEDYLNEVSYDFTNYVPSKAALDIIATIKLIEGERLENKSPIPHLQLLDAVTSNARRLAIMCHRGFAKALSLDSVVYTDKGTTTIKDLRVGESIVGEDGKFTKVTAKSEVFHKPMYSLNLVDGRSIKVCEEHINTVIHKRTVRKNGTKVTEHQRRDLTTKELLKYAITSTRTKTLKNPTGIEHNFWVPINKAVQYTEKALPIDPYTLGVLLGDGSISRDTGYARLHTHIDDLPTYKKCIPYGFGKEYLRDNTVTVGVLGLGKVLKELGLNVHGDFKFIPNEYLYGSIEQRSWLLKGLMDTDGTITKAGNSSFSSNSVLLAEGVATLVRSLGGIAAIVRRTEKSYIVNIKANFNLFNLERKKTREHSKSKEKVAIESIVRISDEPSQCISVDNASKTFLTDNYVVTHNSTLLDLYLPLYLAVYGKLEGFGVVNYIMLVLDSQEGGAKTARKNLEGAYNSSPFLQKYLKKPRFTDTFIEFTNIEGHSIGIKLVGAQQAIRGTLYRNELGSHRPEIAIVDDILTDTDANSETVLSNVKNTIHKAIGKALKPGHNKIYYIGTPFNRKDPLIEVIESGRWNVIVFPIAEKFPCKKEDFKGSWEDRFSYENVLDEYEDAMSLNRPSDFTQELMLRIMSDEDRLLTSSDLPTYNRKDILTDTGSYNFYITTDFATSERSSADFSVISVWAYGNDGRWFWVDGIIERNTMDKNIDELFRLASMYRPMSVGIEVSGQQKGFVSWVEQEMLRRKIFFNLASENNNGEAGIRPSTSTNKLIRFNVILPLFKQKRIFFPEASAVTEMEEAFDELLSISITGFKSKHDDFIDTVSMLSVMKPLEPTSNPAYEYDTVNDIWRNNLNEDEFKKSSYQF